MKVLVQVALQVLCPIEVEYDPDEEVMRPVGAPHGQLKVQEAGFVLNPGTQLSDSLSQDLLLVAQEQVILTMLRGVRNALNQKVQREVRAVEQAEPEGGAKA